MKWIKKGLLFCPTGQYDWMKTHAANPFGAFVQSTVLRIYFTSRDAENRSHISVADFDATNNFSVLKIADQPVLAPGQAGLYDDSGTAMGFLLQEDNRDLLYYLGWNLKVTVPWMNTIGLAIREKGKTSFEKFSRAPIMDRSNEDPFSISYPSVMKENGIYRMWYGSNLSWGKTQDEMQHVIKYAESTDGIHWKRSERVAVALQHSGEYALSKPLVVKENGRYYMFYSYRANGTVQTYRIGFAVSTDGLNWTRKDNEIGIDVSADGWDSQMICYPFVFKYNGNWWMLYNGNGYGATGFGLAMLDGNSFE
jgi:hypothetical protein